MTAGQLELAVAMLGVVAGIVCRRAGYLQLRHVKALSSWLGLVLYPALVFASLTRQFRLEPLVAAWPLPVGTFALCAAGAGTALLVRERLPFASPAERRSFGFAMTMPNYAFLPLPLAGLLWGEAGAARIILGSLGAEIAFWTIGRAFLEAGRFRLRHFVQAPLVALALAVTVITVDSPHLFRLLAPVNELLAPVGAVTIPLAMIILGYHLGYAWDRRLFAPSLLAASGFHAVVLPAVTLAALRALAVPPELAAPLFLVAAMPVAVATVYMSDLFEGDPEYAARCVLSSHLGACLTVPLWLLV